MTEELEIGKVYKGIVRSIKNFGAFVTLDIPTKNRRQPDGLCHISQISATRRIEHPEDVLKIHQQVYVMILDVQQDGKISLSMKNVDQITGEMSFQQDKIMMDGGYKGKSDENRGHKRKQTQDMWELNQINNAFGAKRTMIRSNNQEDPFAELNSTDDESENEGKEEEETVEIELSNGLPPFLQDTDFKNKKSSSGTSGLKVQNQPHGSLSRAALYGSKFMSEAKRIKFEKKQEEEKKRRLEEKQMKSEDPLLNDLMPRVSDIITKPSSSSQHTSSSYTQQNAVEQWKQQSKNESYGIRTTMSMQEQRESLPVFQKREELLNEVQNNDFLVVVGETGSGKTTQITQYLAEDGYGENGIIGCTQPRRVAATSVAKRVAEEVGCRLGDEVGYTIRFEDCTSDKTIIKYMTDGMLQREVLLDPDMKKYTVIMLDEAHERTVATDVLFVLLREAVIRRKGTLKLIVTSATLDSQKFSSYFNNCPVFHIEGRTFPVKIYYTKEPEMDYIESCIDTVIDVHVNNPPGDILVFLTGKEEIDTSCETLVEKMTVLYKSDPNMSELIILPIYSALPSEMQTRIFEETPKGKRKVVLATNIAETSITINGVYYVIDPGFVKVNAYDPKLGMDSLQIQPISRAQADQRSGRAGRTGPGICYRLYTKHAYMNEMSANTIPEIQRQNLSYTILMLKAMGITDVLKFEFMDRPNEESILTALEELYILEALDEDGKLTEIGKYMAYFPMEPLLAKTLIKSIEFQCSYEVIIIIAMLSVPDIFYRPKEKKDQADKMKMKFQDYNGDHLTLLNVYNKWEDNQHSSKSWCQDHFIHEKSVKRARDVKKQLIKIMENLDKLEKRLNSSIISCNGNLNQVRKAFVSGFFKNCAKRSSNHGHTNEEGAYRTLVENTPVHIHPSSSLFKKNGVDYVIYHTLVLTNKEYMHCITKIEPKWLIQYASKFYKNADPNQLSRTKKREKIQPLFNRNDPKEKWRLSKGRR